ncbi:MAG: hypothetical protein WDM94_07280 [Bauldia sp.]
MTDADEEDRREGVRLRAAVNDALATFRKKIATASLGELRGAVNNLAASTEIKNEAGGVTGWRDGRKAVVLHDALLSLQRDNASNESLRKLSNALARWDGSGGV